MSRPFHLVNEIEVPATPEQAWEALTMGPQLDSWFMGHNDVDPREGGTVRMDGPGFIEEATIVAWEPPAHFATRSTESPDGRKSVFDWRIEDRGAGRTAIRWTHTGEIPGDWEAEYEAMGEGDPAYLAKLQQYLTHFAGRHGASIEAFGPGADGQTETMEGYREGLGLPGPVSVGDRVVLTPEGFEPIDGEVEWVSPSFLGVRSDDALYRFIWPFVGGSMVGHHDFSGNVDGEQASAAWQAWLERTFG